LIYMKKALFLVFLGSVQIAIAQQSHIGLTVEAAAAPRYPLIAYTVGKEGVVDVDIEIEINGAVIRSKAISGPYMLRPASEKAALAWRFQKVSSPTIRKARLVFKFVLNKSNPTGMSSVFNPPFEMEVIGEEEKTQILDDPPLDPIPAPPGRK
jgi:hypothetical protein